MAERGLREISPNIGQKIKDIRLRRKMTQAMLCGSKVTRNLLSLIERGRAAPSLKTLSYFAERLDVPVGYFFSNDEKEEATYVKAGMIDGLKTAYKNERYQSCIDQCAELPPRFRDDEISLLLAGSYYYEAMRLSNQYLLKQAADYLQRAKDTAANTIYLDHFFEAATAYYTLLISALEESVLPRALRETERASSYIPVEMIEYFQALHTAQYAWFMDRHARVSSPHPLHMEALALMEAGAFAGAIEKINGLLPIPSLPFYMRYRVSDCLERCAHETGDYRTAYLAARIKLDLHEAASK